MAARANFIKYSTAPVAWFPWLVGQINWLPDGEVLEVGCGPGWLWVEAADDLPSGLRLTLTDLSPGMVTVARDRVQGLGKYTVVRAEEADAHQLPFDDGSFDVVVANHMLYHTNPTRAVTELARVLRDDGVLVASTNGPRDLVIELWDISAEVFEGASAREAVAVFSSVTGLPIVQSSFESVERREYKDELWCTDPDDVVASIISAPRPGWRAADLEPPHPPAEHAPPAQLDQLRAAVQRHFDAGGGVLKLSTEICVFLCREPH